MPKHPIYQVDAFTDRLFAGNPAAVVPLEAFPPDAVMLAVAAENNLAETAYLVPAGPARWELRWFTPTIEVPLCGHATLASAFVLTEVLGQGVLGDGAETLTFVTRQSGELTVTRGDDGWYAMRFPMRRQAGAIAPERVAAALGAMPREVVEYDAANDVSWLAVFEDEAAVRALDPDMRAVAGLAPRNIVATAKGGTGPDGPLDFVSRMFAPKAGIDEDPVTGSAHCSLVPFWAERLGKTEFVARQVSKRGGDLKCRLDGETVVVSGQAVLYMTGEIELPD